MTTPARPNGFTLVELLVVLIVIGLIIALAPIALYRTMPSLELRTTTRELAAALRNTRSTAIRDNREMALTLDVEASWYRLDGREGEQEIDPEIELKLLTATIEAENENVGRIRFFPDGTSTGGQITLARGEDTYYILVDWLSGRVEIADKVEE
jgi:general secretion pathway protein H